MKVVRTTAVHRTDHIQMGKAHIFLYPQKLGHFWTLLDFTGQSIVDKMYL
jgi:hypothetical protein